MTINVTTLEMNQKVGSEIAGGGKYREVVWCLCKSLTETVTKFVLHQVGKPPSTFIISLREFLPPKILDFCVV